MNQLYMGWVIQWLFALMVAGAVYSLPSSILNRANWQQLMWIERLVIGAFLVVISLFISGVLVALLPYGLRQIFSYAIISFLIIASVVGMRRGGWRDLQSSANNQRLVAATTLALSMIALTVAWLPVRLPAQLIDGPYVIKQDMPAVRVQHISGTLPIDNAIPHVASQYLLRDIKFSDERPLMPGQEVSNRPIMVSLLMLPWHAIVAMPSQQHEPLPRFTYVGHTWPDFSELLNNVNSWAVSVSIGTALNALLILVVGAWLVRQPFSDSKVIGIFALLALSSPYVLIQTFFTWPKSLAGFFIVSGYIFILRKLPVYFAAVALGLAYWSHPYAVVYFIFFAIWLLYYIEEDKEKRIANAYFKAKNIRFIIVFVAVVLPWFIWTRLVVRIPSDLVAQNFVQSGQSLYDFIWVRFVNIYTTFAPTFLQIYPFDSYVLVRTMSVTFAGAVGLAPLIILVHMYSKIENIHKDVVIPLFFPGVVLVAVFSNIAVPALHGLQPLVMLSIAASVSYVANSKYNVILNIVLLVQVLLNIAIIHRYLNFLQSN